MLIHDYPSFVRRCVSCPSQAPQCLCAPNQQCIVVGQGCDTCATARCVDSGGQSAGGGGGVSKGAVAGGVIGALILLGLALGILFWYRRRSASLRSQDVQDVKPDVPAPAHAVLNREDPYEKDARSPSPSQSVLDAYQRYNAMMALTANAAQQDQHRQDTRPLAGPSFDRRQSANGSVQSDPFKDTHSIQTASASTQSTSVIPIALVRHDPSSLSGTSDEISQTSSTPSRPARSPDLNLDPLSAALNLEHVNISRDSFRPPNAPYANSQVSGLSGSSLRDSVLTTGTYASDLLTEAPQIVTPASGAVRKFLGVAKAEVILAPGSNPATPNSFGSSSSRPATRTALRSPLAQTSFGPTDTLHEAYAEGQDIEYPIRNPFSDENSMIGKSPTGSTSTLGMPTPIPLPSTASPTQHTHSINTSDRSYLSSDTSRPLSTATAAGSVIAADIGSATLVRLDSSASHNSARSQNRFTSARLVSPLVTGDNRPADGDVLQSQQMHAMALARARAEAANLPLANATYANRMSDAGSVASNGGFSILESFDFVPPSPISNLPPRSPTTQRQLTATSPATTTGSSRSASESMHSSASTVRQLQGMSTTSNVSALAGYDFRIESGSIPHTPNTANTLQQQQEQATTGSSTTVQSGGQGGAKRQRQRASLDTLALTADLSAFPLSFDEGMRDSFATVRK